jgi:hypothetical protein
VKLSTITRERATFKDFHGEGTIAFQHKLKKVQWKQKQIKILNYSYRRQKGSYFPTHVYVHLKVAAPTNKYLPS